MKTIPFWTDHTPRPEDLPTAALPVRTDVAIVGGGYTGLSAAIALAKAGVDVTVVEAQTIGWGASSRNGGMMTTGLKDDMPGVFKHYGAETGRLFWEWALASVDFVERTVAEERIACDFARNGHLHLAYKPGHLASMREAVTWYARQLGYHDMWLVEQEDLGDEIGSASYFGAIVDRQAAGLHPAKYVFGLAQAAARHGVRLVEQVRIEEIARAEDGFRLTVARGTPEEASLLASEVLMATNGYTDNLVPYLRQGVFPVGSYIITTEVLPAALQAELSPKGRMFFDSKHFLNYFRLTPDGRMLFGGRHNLSPNLDVIESAQMMRQRMVEVFPALADVSLSHTWTGKLGLTFDLMPHTGRIPSGPHEGLFFAYGYAGHGLAVASYLGHQIGNMLAGCGQEPAFAQVKQQRYFFTKYDALYLPVVSNWFRFLDRVS
jgi:glycine/D-amino acid oxidase-like deaminating enzyme